MKKMKTILGLLHTTATVTVADVIQGVTSKKLRLFKSMLLFGVMSWHSAGAHAGQADADYVRHILAASVAHCEQVSNDLAKKAEHLTNSKVVGAPQRLQNSNSDMISAFYYRMENGKICAMPFEEAATADEATGFIYTYCADREMTGNCK